jgi:predicted nucleic acid-binding protein
MRIVQDTNVMVAALRNGAGASRQVLLSCLRRVHDPLMGIALWNEYQDVMSRPELWRDSQTDPRQRQIILDAFASVAIWVQIWFSWRPNLPDEGDNQVFELALNGNAAALVTFNLKDFESALIIKGLDILPPGRFVKKYPI